MTAGVDEVGRVVGGFGEEAGAHGVGDEDPVRRSSAAQAGRLDDGGAEPVVLLGRGLAEADPDAHGERCARLAVIEAGSGPLQLDRAVNGLAARGEGDHQAVALALHLLAAVRGEGLPPAREQVAAELVVRRLAEARQDGGRVDEIAEDDRDLGAVPGQRRHSPPTSRRAS